MATDEDKANGYKRDDLEDGTVKITILKTNREFILEEPDFDKRDSVYSVVRKLVNSVDSKEIQQKKREIAKLKNISMEALHEEMETGVLDGDFVVDIENLVREGNMSLLADDKQYMMEVIGSAMNKDEKEWPNLAKGMKMSEGKFLYDACLAFLIELFNEMQGDRKKS